MRTIIFKILCENCRIKENECMISVDRLESMGFDEVTRTNSLYHCCKAVKDSNDDGYTESRIIFENFDGVLQIAKRKTYTEFILGRFKRGIKTKLVEAN